MTEIEKLAMLICLETTEKQNQYARAAYVPWNLIKELREAFGDHYVQARKRMKEIQAEAR